MARMHPLPPSAHSMSTSLRDLGYSLETAVADIVDNSISAEATEVGIICDISSDIPILVIWDNGCGMNEEELLVAMRHGALGPEQKRNRMDLGRFGLGLKTASFSQCLKLTVVSVQDGQWCGAEWDLDLVKETDDWLISVLEETDIADVPFINQLGTNGTLVLWRKLDRLFDESQKDDHDEVVNEKLDILEKHLALVFHRFLDGEIRGRKRLSLSINGHPVEGFDPFCRKSGSQLLPPETVHLGAEEVYLQAYILPHHSRLSAREEAYYQSRSEFLSNQGAYVYRNGRLMAWGDWFRLIPKGETTKLARVQIDFSNTLDDAWTIDIKKSTVRPPYLVRERLRQILPQISESSTRIHRGRGQKLFSETKAPIWERFAEQNGSIRYALNRDHALIATLKSKFSDAENRILEVLLEAVGSSVPVEMIYSDFSMHPRKLDTSSLSDEESLAKLKEVHFALFGTDPLEREKFLEVVQSLRLVDGRTDLVEKYIREGCYE